MIKPKKNWKTEPKKASMREVVGEVLVELASENKNLVVVSIDLKTSMGLSGFASKFPKRFVECGVAENNAAGVAAGLAKGGKTVFLASFACFSPAINWAVIKQSICYNHANVKIIGSHTGLASGDLGATHQMLEDLALMRVLPNMQVFSPIDAVEAKKIVTTTAWSPLPAYIRLVRPETEVVTETKTQFTIGKSEVLKKGSKVTVLGHGPILARWLQATNIKDQEIINCSSIKPLDSETILKSIKKTERCLVIEDHQKIGGLGEAVAGLILESGMKCQFKHLGINNRFGQSARRIEDLYSEYEIDNESIEQTLEEMLKK